MTDTTQSLRDQAKVKCFSSKAALCVEATQAAHNKSSSYSTVNIEVAPRHGSDVDWSRKIVIQLSDSELPLLCSTLLGFLPSVSLKRPGKGIEIERQASKLFVRASAGSGNLFVLPVTIGDTFCLASVALAQLKLQSGLDDALVLAALRGSSALFRKE